MAIIELTNDRTKTLHQAVFINVPSAVVAADPQFEGQH